MVAEIIIATVPRPIHDHPWGGGSAAILLLLLPHNDAVYDGIIMYQLVHWGCVRIIPTKRKKKKKKIEKTKEMN